MLADLVKKLTEAKDAYYNGTPVLSDSAYDALEDQLRAMDPTNAFFAKVGAATPSNGAWPKVKHSTPMGSLGKAQEFSEMETWYRGLPGQPKLILSEKLDGISICLKYENRRFVQALTRGDGTIGEDITRNVALMQGVVTILPATMMDGTPTPNLLFVRGEIILRWSDFQTGFPIEYAAWKAGKGSNPRNSASGTAKRQSDAGLCRYLMVKTYQYLPNGMATLPSKEAEFDNLIHAGFSTPLRIGITNLSEVQSTYQKYISTIRPALGYDIDGLVIEINDTKTREYMGEHNGKPKGAIAFKFPHEEQATTLRNVRWQVGNSGRVTPVAEFDMVALAGAQVKQASLAGVRQVMHLKLYEGCRILVSRRNDCIPRVEANLDEGIENDI
jgi:DNA ligase (NAD+)